MYCEYCGTENSDSDAFCQNCGKPLSKGSHTPPPPVTTGKQKSILSRIASIGFLIVIVGFFLPWASVSCSSGFFDTPPIKVSGYELATGKLPGMSEVSSLGSSMTNLFGGYLGGTDFSSMIGQAKQQVSTGWLWLVLVAALIGMVSLAGGSTGRIAAIVAGVILGVMLVIFGVKVSSMGSDAQLTGFKLKTESGYIISWLGTAFGFVMGLVNPKKEV